MKTRAILLDVDGTLIDSNLAHAESWSQALRSQGRSMDTSSILKTIGMGGDHFLPEFVGVSSQSPEGRLLSRIRGEIFRNDYLQNLKAFDGALEMLQYFKRLGLKLIVATSASREDGNAILEKFGFDRLVDEVTCSADAEHSKPNSDIIEAALKKGNIDRSEAIMIGDTPYDIAAAVEAQVRVIGFTSKLWTQATMKHADFYFSGPRDLLDTHSIGEARLLL